MTPTIYTPAQRAQAAELLSISRRRIGQHKRFALFWPIMSVGSYSIDDSTPTACTNGRDTKYGTGWLLEHGTLQGKVINFTVLHEEGHKVFMHLSDPTYHRMWEIDRDVTRRSLDHWLNLSLMSMDPRQTFIDMPRNPQGQVTVLYEPQRFTGKTVVEIFRMLRAKKKQQQEEEGQPGEGQGQPGEGQGQGQGQPGEGQSFDEHDFEAANNMTPEEKADAREAVRKAAEQGMHFARKFSPTGTGNMAASIKQMLQPKVRWKDYMRSFLQDNMGAGDDDVTFRRLHRTYASQGLIVPTSAAITAKPIIVACDLSASMWSGKPSNVQRVISEMVGLLKAVRPEKVDVLYWDTAVQGHEVYQGDKLDDLQRLTKPTGGGGTSLSCVSSYIKEKKLSPACIVVLTDGEVGTDWGSKWSAPVLFGVVNRESITAPHGRTVHISTEEQS